MRLTGRRRYVAVELTRLVARSLEREWHEKLAHLNSWSGSTPRGAHTPSALSAPKSASACWPGPGRAGCLARADDHAYRAQTTAALPGQRCDLTRRDNIITIALRWQTGALTTFDIPRLRKSWEVRQTAPRAVARIRELAPRIPTSRLPRAAMRMGCRPASVGRSRSARLDGYVGPMASRRGVQNGHKSARVASGATGATRRRRRPSCSTCMSRHSEWCKQGRLDGLRSRPMGPRWITLTPEIITALRRPTRRCHCRRRMAA